MYKKTKKIVYVKGSVFENYYVNSSKDLWSKWVVTINKKSYKIDNISYNISFQQLPKKLQKQIETDNNSNGNIPAEYTIYNNEYIDYNEYMNYYIYE